MAWYQYLAGFFAGAFFINSIPHFIKGISGDKFPTPFATPPGKGLSSAPLNVCWAAMNFIVAGLLFRKSHFHHEQILNMLIFLVGAGLMSFFLSVTFQKKHKE